MLTAIHRFARLYSHVYWHKKAQFALDKDVYDRWTLFAVEEGKFNYQIGEHAGEAGFADLVLCPPQIWFGRIVIEPLSFHFFHFDWNEPDVQFGEDHEPMGRGKFSLEDTQRVSSTFRLLSPLEGTEEERTHAGKQHLLNDLLFQALSEGQTRNRIPADKQEEDPVMRGAMNRIMEHAYKTLSMRGLANDLGITPVQLTRRFRSAYGQTPLEYLTDLRLRRASHLLEETSLSLEKIAQQCGYENGFYLSRVFHKKRGVSPSLYRKMNQV
jgi:AraC family transcriptional regulator